MNSELLQISVDLLLIFRIFAGFAWGILWATYIQFNRHGQFLAKERTWITVVIGIGVDLLIAFPASWVTVVLVIFASSLGIIARSLWNEQHQTELNNKSYKLLWGLEDAIAVSHNQIEILNKLLTSGHMNPADIRHVSDLVAKTHQLKNALVEIRQGNYQTK